VTRGRVHVKDANGNIRVYDGMATSPRNHNIGLEIKSGNAKRTPSQRDFDSWLNSSPVHVATGFGQVAGQQISRSILIRRMMR
jgi:hypothetical protein